MASGKKQLEGIALLSVYKDEDDEDMEDADDQQQEELSEEMNEYRESNEIGSDSVIDVVVTDKLATEGTPPVLIQNSTPKEPLLTPQQLQPQVLFSSSPQHQQEQQQCVVNTVTKRGGIGRLTIVDYAHDEAAMSPEPDEEEFSGELQTANGNCDFAGPIHGTNIG